PYTGERSFAHAKRHDVIGDGRVESALRVDQKLIAKVQILAHLLVVGFPSKLHVTATIVAIQIGFPVTAGDWNGVPIGLTLSLAEFLDWSPRIRALVLDRGQHVSTPARVAYISIVLEEIKQCVHPRGLAVVERTVFPFVQTDELLVIEFHLTHL